jgi:endonuclease/exonuclease/phosphatase family metal-dependent hydrolase
MAHLSRLLVSTRAQVCFISESRNSSITKTAIKNHFNLNDAFVVPAQGQSGGLWLIWNDEVHITVVDHSQNFIFALCINKTSMHQYGLVCIYGDPHHRTTSVIWQHVLDFVTQNHNLPMFCMGDLNELMHVNEKLGPTRADVNRINEFCAFVKQCGFIDLGYSGPAYTWTNKRFSSVPTYERLDRCLGNADWCMAFPSTTIYHLPMMYSDHAPILAVLNSRRARTNKPFRFKNWWLMEQEYHKVARQSWIRSSARSFNQKQATLLLI